MIIGPFEVEQSILNEKPSFLDKITYTDITTNIIQKSYFEILSKI